MIADLYGLLISCAESFPEAVAISAPGRKSLTYNRLLANVNKAASEISAQGIHRNNRLAIVLPNGPEMAVAFLAVTACATSAPLNPSYRAEEFEFYLSDLNARAVIVQSSTNSPAVSAANKLNIPIIELIPNEAEEAGVFDFRAPAADSSNQVEYARPEDTALVLHTSGTTSKPKIVPLSQANICSSAQNIQKFLKLRPNDACLNVMPLFHVHGLVAALLASITAGARIICTPGFVAPEFFNWMSECRPTWYTAVPTIHQSVLKRAPQNSSIIAASSLRFIRSCSSPLSPNTMRELEGLFKIPVIEAYGMTEASHQIASNPLPPRRRKSGSVGLATGTKIAIMDDAGAFVPDGETGEIVIQGENVIESYENNPEANRNGFTDGWFRTGDQGFLDTSKYLFITGRLKEIINRGGEKISPREIDDILLEHPAVSQAIAFAVPDPQMGEDIAAAVVLKDNQEASERELQDFAATRLADFKIPRRLLFVKEIPKGPTGKPQRIQLAKTLGVSFESKSETKPHAVFQPPRTDVERLLAQIWGEVLGLPQVGVLHTFIELGGDSLLATRIVSRLSESLQVEMSPRDFFRTPTIETMAKVIENKLLEDMGEDSKT